MQVRMLRWHPIWATATVSSFLTLIAYRQVLDANRCPPHKCAAASAFHSGEPRCRKKMVTTTIAHKTGSRSASSEMIRTRIVEARAGTTDRSQAAAFAGILDKPFDVDELVDVVARLSGKQVEYQTSGGAESHRAARLRSKLESAGAREIHYRLGVNGRISRPPTTH
jgi:hypothetical protein